MRAAALCPRPALERHRQRGRMSSLQLRHARAACRARGPSSSSRPTARCSRVTTALPHEAVPVSKLESGAHWPASELAEAERKPVMLCNGRQRNWRHRSINPIHRNPAVRLSRDWEPRLSDGCSVNTRRQFDANTAQIHALAQGGKWHGVCFKRRARPLRLARSAR